MNRRSQLSTALAFAFAALVCGQCRREDAPRARPPLLAVAAAVAVDRPVAVATPEREPEPAEPPPALGAWLDGNIYRFRLEAVRPCTAPASALAGAARVAVLVRVASNLDQLLVAPRDFKLEANGVILDSAVLQSAPAGCGPLLAPTSVRAGKSADGVVVFDIPPGFNPDHRPVKLAYQPTRWGGARRVEAVLPAGSLQR